MGIKFVGDVTQNDKHDITLVLHDLMQPYSKFANINVIYNNTLHYNRPDIPPICDFSALYDIGMTSYSTEPSDMIIVDRGIHTNHHMSNIVVDMENNPLLTMDTYFSFSFINYPENRFHIYILPPSIEEVKYMLMLNSCCDIPQMILPPIFAHI